MRKEIIALLPMKDHSERVPNKNMRLLNGKPLYHWVVNALLNVDKIKEILIDTDSEMIIDDVNKNFSRDRVIAFRRQDYLLGDFVSMNPIIEYDISLSDNQYFMQTHATNPLLTSNTIRKAIDFYFDNLSVYDSVFAVNKIQSRLYDYDGKPINHNPTEMLRTQDLLPIYEENSNFYLFSKASFADSGKRRIGNKPNMFVVSKLESVDIDEEDDFLLAESIMLSRKDGAV